jgi:hypothetical protein
VLDETLPSGSKPLQALTLAKQAFEIAEQEGRSTVFSLVDALTRLSGRFEHAGVRTDSGEKAGKLLALAV